MNSLPLISVITVCYQAAEPLEKTILSVRQQYYQPLEFIVVDGGSTDGTRDIIARHQDIITRWVSEPDRGIYDAMNKGVSMATGEWVIFMNAGDTFAANDVLLRIFKKRNTPQRPTPNPSRGEGSLISIIVIRKGVYAPLPSGGAGGGSLGGGSLGGGSLGGGCVWARSFFKDSQQHIVSGEGVASIHEDYPLARCHADAFVHCIIDAAVWL